jgi:hypothetical protein
MLPFIAVIAGIGLVILAGIVLVIFFVRRSRRDSKSAALSIGFRPLSPPYSGLSEVIFALYPQQRADSLELMDVYLRTMPDMRLVMFTLVTRSSRESITYHRNLVAALMPGLDLPAFSLIPRMDIPGEGSLAGFLEDSMEQIIDLGAERAGLEQVYFPDEDPFGQRWTILARDPVAVKSLLTPERRASLVEFPAWAILAVSGEAVLVQPAASQPGRPFETRIRQQMELTIKAINCLVASPPNSSGKIKVIS